MITLFRWSARFGHFCGFPIFDEQYAVLLSFSPFFPNIPLSASFPILIDSRRLVYHLRKEEWRILITSPLIIPYT